MIFVDNTSEYPWEEEDFLIFKLKRPSTEYQVSLFGFPYYRNWQGIRDLIVSDGRSQNFTTNEKKSIPRYYLPINNNSEYVGYIILVSRPQSGTTYISNKRAADWAKNNKPIQVYEYNGRVIARIFYVDEAWGDYLRKNN